MARIVEAAEGGASLGDTSDWATCEDGQDAVFGDAIAAAACEVGRRLGAAALCCFTRTGNTALRLAQQRSPLPLLAFVHDESVRARLAYSWGVESAVVAPAAKAETMATEVSEALVAMGTCHPGDVVVVVSGSRSGVAGYTDSVRVLRIE
jgi:pyruvate kinase